MKHVFSFVLTAALVVLMGVPAHAQRWKDRTQGTNLTDRITVDQLPMIPATKLIAGSLPASVVGPDSLGYGEWVDTPTLDATTTTSLGAFDLIFNLESTGDVIFQDNGVAFLTFTDAAGITYAGAALTSSAAMQWTAMDNTANAVCVGATGSLSMLCLDTSNSAPTVTAGNGFTVTGAATFNGNVFLGNAVADGITFAGLVLGATPLAFEGLNVDGVNITSFTVIDPTAPRSIAIPDASGTVAVSASGNAALSAAGDISFTGTLAATSGGTGQSTYAVGDLLVGGAVNTLDKVAAVAVGSALISTGVTTAPVWGNPALAAKATDLAANGANCTNQFPLGVDASGAAEACTSITAAYMAADSVTGSELSETLAFDADEDVSLAAQRVAGGAGNTITIRGADGVSLPGDAAGGNVILWPGANWASGEPGYVDIAGTGRLGATADRVTTAYINALNTTSLNVANPASLDGGFSVDTPAFTVANTTGATGIVHTATTGTALNVSYPAATTQTDFARGINVDLSTLTPSAVAAYYGVHVQSPAGAAGGTQYGLYVQGTNFDKSIVADQVAQFDGGFTVDTTNFTVNGTTGAIHTASTLDVDGAITAGGAITTDAAFDIKPVSTGAGAGGASKVTGQESSVGAGGTLSITAGAATAAAQAGGALYLDAGDPGAAGTAGTIYIGANGASAVTVTPVLNADSGIKVDTDNFVVNGTSGEISQDGVLAGTMHGMTWGTETLTNDVTGYMFSMPMVNAATKNVYGAYFVGPLTNGANAAAIKFTNNWTTLLQSTGQYGVIDIKVVSTDASLRLTNSAGTGGTVMLEVDSENNSAVEDVLVLRTDYVSPAFSCGASCATVVSISGVTHASDTAKTYVEADGDTYIGGALVGSVQTVTLPDDNTGTKALSVHGTTMIVTSAALTGDVLFDNQFSLNAGVAGQILYLVAVDDATHSPILIAGATGKYGAGAPYTLTNNDAVTLLYTGTNWIQVSAVQVNAN